MFLANLSPEVVAIWVWLAVAIICLIIELLTSELVSIWSAIAATVTMIIAVWFDNIYAQVIIFVAISVILMIFTRPIAKKYFKKNTIKTNFEALIGKKVLVLKEIKPHQSGEIKVDGNIWLAISHNNKEIAKDANVEILAIDGVKLIVRECLEENLD
ncbi:MAG: NfeD family protein [Anaeroplasmataceae bacterium]